MSTIRAARIPIVAASVSLVVVCMSGVLRAAQSPQGSTTTTRTRAQAARVQVATVAMPNLVGRLYLAALQDPVVARYKIGLSAKDTPSEARTGTIVGQEPAAGTAIRPGASATVFVAIARQPPPPGRGGVRIPDVLIQRPDRVVTPTRPQAPDDVGPALGRMPNLVGQSFDLAVRRPDVRELRLRLERLPDSTAPGLPGTVLKQSVPPGAGVEIGRSVSVVVATGVAVPFVMRQPSAMAEREIAAAGLRPAASSVLSDQEPGTVVTQTPAAGVLVPRGAAVAITVARARPRPDDVPVPPRGAGPVLPPVTPDPVLIRMPDLVGRSFTLAVQHPEVLGARLRLEQQFDSTAPGLPGTIVRQSVPAGSGVEVGRSVAVLVSTGVAVPLVLKQASGVAERQIAAAGLRPAVSNATSDLEPGTVIEQVPAAGVVVSRGASVAITIAVAAKVTVPDVIGRTRVEADQELTRLKLRVVAEDDPLSTSEPGRIATQQPASGADVLAGATVRVGVATGVVVPATVGQARDRAAALAAAAGLVVSVQSTDQTGTAGLVSGQQPLANARVARGTTLTLFIPLPGVATVAVPDLVGRSQQDAQGVLARLRLVARISDGDSDRPVGTVISQSPVAGTQVSPPSEVALVLARQAVQPVQPGAPPVSNTAVPGPSSGPVEPLLPVWFGPLLVVVTLVGLSALGLVRSGRGKPGPRTSPQPPPDVTVEPQQGEHSLRLEVQGRSLVDLEVRVRVTKDAGEQSVQVAEGPLVAEERRVYE